MSTCAECKAFFAIPESADDFEPGKGDCVLEETDQKGKFWLAKPVMGETEQCKLFVKKLVN